MQLINVDIGNSCCKFAVMSFDQPVDRQQLIHRPDWIFEARQFNHVVDFSSVTRGDREVACWLVCSVNNPLTRKLMDWLSQHRPNDQVHVLDRNNVELATDLENPNQVGIDRLLAALAGWELAGRGPVVIVDAGTAVTVDIVSSAGVFEGGLIFPGAEISLDSLARRTSSLPRVDPTLEVEIEPDSIASFIGKSTASAIVKGVFRSQLAAINGLVESARRLLGTEAKVVITGGGLLQTHQSLPPDWIHVPDLVLRGVAVAGIAVVPAINFES